MNNRIDRRVLAGVCLIVLTAGMAAPSVAYPLDQTPSGDLDVTTEAALGAFGSGLDTVDRWLDEAERLLSPVPTGPHLPEQVLGRSLMPSYAKLVPIERVLEPQLLGAVGWLADAMEKGARSDELSGMVTDLLPVFRAAAGSIDEDVDLRPLGGPPGSSGGIYIADESDGVYDFQDDAFAFGSSGGIFIDLGGDDTYLAQDSSFGSLGGLFIDLDGHDSYVSGYVEGGKPPPEGSLGAYGHTSFGTDGVFVDVRGDDSYHANRDTFGVAPGGLFYDAAGNDTYRSGSDGFQNTGSFGYAQGRFVDRAGDDHYVATANAFGNARGVFFELAGSDRYEFLNEGGAAATQANGFGAFQGGVMVEYAGDDQYWVMRGNSNFGANGVFVDRAGNDWYGRDEARKHNLNGRTSFGYGTSDGVFADLRGDDQYFARDTSFGHGGGTFMDLGGNDAYHVSHDAPNPSNGCNVFCDSFGIGRVNPPGGWFLDYDGDDVYETYRTPGQLAARRMFGGNTGAFIERRGDDTYRTGNEAFASNLVVPGLAADLDGDDLYDILDGQVGATGVFVDDGGTSDRNDQMVVAGEASPMIPLPVSLGSPPGPDPVAAALGLEQDLADLIDAVVCSSAPAHEAGICPFPGASPTASPTPSPSATPEPTPTETASPTPTESVSPSPSESPEPETATVAFTERSAESGQYSDETLFEARLTDSNGDPIAGQELTFELIGAESSRGYSATTDEDGVAQVTPKLEEKPGSHQLTVRFAGDEDHAGDADTVSFVVEKEDTALELSVHGEDDDKTLRARLSDLDTSSDGIAQRTIDFYSDGEFIGSHQTDADGVASVALPPGHRGNNRTYEAVFEGDDFHLGSSDERAGKGKGKGGTGGGNGGNGGGGEGGRTYAGRMFLM